jgi:hypothetical protein
VVLGDVIHAGIDICLSLRFTLLITKENDKAIKGFGLDGWNQGGIVLDQLPKQVEAGPLARRVHLDSDIG